MSRQVKCIKLNKEADGLDFPPIPGELGKKIWENVSKEMLRPAWVFDTRGIIPLKDLKSNSLRFWSIGNGDN